MNGTKSRSTRIRRTDQEARRTDYCQRSKQGQGVRALFMYVHARTYQGSYMMRTFLSTSCSSRPTSKPSDWKQAGHYDNPVIAQHSPSTPWRRRIPATTTTTNRLRHDARWLPQLLLRTNKLVGDEFQMLDVSTTNCSDMVSNYSSEVPSNSAVAIDNSAMNQAKWRFDF